MLHRESATTPSESFADNSYRRPPSPLHSTQEGYERLKKHAELHETAEKAFKSAEDVIDKLENMNANYEQCGRWSLVTDVETKMDTYKQMIPADSSDDHEKLWNVVQADLIIANQQTKMNEILLKSNADLKCQLVMAKEIFSLTQTEAVESLRGVVRESLQLLKSREDEAFNWKTMHHDSTAEGDALRKELKTVQKKFDDTQKKLATADEECRGLKQILQQTEQIAKERETQIKKLEQDLQEMRRKNGLLKSEVEQKTDELASLDTDVRKAAIDYEQQREAHKKAIEKYKHDFAVTMSQELDKQEKQLIDDHRKQLEQLEIQYRKLDNERNMLQNKLGEYKEALNEVRRENEYLKRNSKQIKQDLLAQCQRRVFSALNYDTHSSSDSPLIPRNSVLPRSRSVVFQEDDREHSIEKVQPSHPTDPVKRSNQQRLPTRTDTALPPATSQVRKRPPIVRRP